MVNKVTSLHCSSACIILGSKQGRLKEADWEEGLCSGQAMGRKASHDTQSCSQQHSLPQNTAHHRTQPRQWPTCAVTSVLLPEQIARLRREGHRGDVPTTGSRWASHSLTHTHKCTHAHTTQQTHAHTHTYLGNWCGSSDSE